MQIRIVLIENYNTLLYRQSLRTAKITRVELSMVPFHTPEVDGCAVVVVMTRAKVVNRAVVMVLGRVVEIREVVVLEYTAVVVIMGPE